jgi:hypothetical protein
MTRSVLFTNKGDRISFVAIIIGALLPNIVKNTGSAGLLPDVPWFVCRFSWPELEFGFAVSRIVLN